MCIFAKDRVEGRTPSRRRLTLLGLTLFLAAVVLLPLGSYVYTGLSPAQAAAEKQTNPRANYWRAVRDGDAGYSAVTNRRMDGTVINVQPDTLIQNGGQNWREVRNGLVATIMPWILGIVLLAIAAYYLLQGPLKLERRPSGKVVPRWSVAERVLHWYTATLFIILGLTGLSIFFGRAVLIPVLGAYGFSAWAQFAINLHNFLGPFFVIGVVLEIIVWVRYNIPDKADWEWIKQGGGMIGKGKHPHAGRINGGEKVATFWVGLVLLGITTSVTGFILLGWFGAQLREPMQVANVVHSVAAITWVAIMFGHMYLGVAVQGALESMTKGYVSEEWARQHHDLWYDEMAKKGEVRIAPDGGTASTRKA